ncbi:unnamed protein product [Wuchereria bancrofti]|uniref:Uncharacterized protein n=1 Tax=Wuchereria bancrofti TaxID=6293 RepID=A0A3P7E6E7_WUCBA|nr:unnamed protein product [Wuchereria bancrofti]
MTLSSSGMYHRRWASASNDGNSTTTRRSGNVTQAITPHTYALLCSWNSIRWNKPLESNGGTIGGRYCSRSMPFFESLSKDYSTPPLGHIGLQSASKNNIELKNSGPYIRERSVRFGDSVLSVMNDKTSRRTSPRLPWLPDNLTNRKNTTYNKVTRNLRESSFNANSRWTSPSLSSARSFQSGMRSTVPASSSSATISLHDKTFLSNTSQTINNNHGNATLKTADRPWRRRMADAARLRIVHGDEIGGAVHSTLTTMRARRSSIPNGRNCTSNNGSDELRNTLNALKNYIDEQTTGFYRQNNRFSARNSPIFTDKLSFDNSMISFKQHTHNRGFYSNRWNSGRFSEYMSRSYSPVRPRTNAFNTKLSKYNSISTDMLLRPLRFNDNNLHENVNSIDPVVRNLTIPESICERESNSRLLSSKERTLRYQSRQRKLEIETNSSSDNEQQIDTRKRKLRKRLRKKCNDDDKSESKQLLRSAEKRMIITDNEISVVSLITLQCYNFLSYSILEITFSTKCNERSKLKVIPTKYDKG